MEGKEGRKWQSVTCIFAMCLHVPSTELVWFHSVAGKLFTLLTNGQFGHKFQYYWHWLMALSQVRSTVVIFCLNDNYLHAPPTHPLSHGIFEKPTRLNFLYHSLSGCSMKSLRIIACLYYCPQEGSLCILRTMLALICEFHFATGALVECTRR